MSECGEFHNCPIASDVREIAVETGKQTVKIDQACADLCEMKNLLLGIDGTGGLNGRVGAVERRTEAHDLAAAADRYKRERRFLFYGRVFWLFVTPMLTAAGISVVAIAAKLFHLLK